MSAKKEYVKLWLSYETYFQSYTPEEVGRLVLAMLRYKDTGEVPAFQGNERFIWPAVQRDIDEAREAQEAAAEKHRECGKKGGKRRDETPPPDTENQNGSFTTNLPPRTKDKDIVKDIVKDRDRDREKGQGQYALPEEFAAVDRLLAEIMSGAG